MWSPESRWCISTIYVAYTYLPELISLYQKEEQDAEAALEKWKICIQKRNDGFKACEEKYPEHGKKWDDCLKAVLEQYDICRGIKAPKPSAPSAPGSKF